WHIVTLTSPSGSAPLCFTHTQVILAHPPTVLLPSRAPHTGVNLPGCPSHSFTGMPLMTSQRAIPLLTPFVAKGERGHPTRTRTRVYRVPNMRSDRQTKKPGSMAWQPEHIFTCRDDHIVTASNHIISGIMYSPAVIIEKKK